MGRHITRLENMTPEQKRLRAQLAAAVMWSKTDGKEHLKPARAAFMAL